MGTTIISEDANILRLIVFISVLAIMAFLEIFLPRRKRNFPRKKRWITNIIIAGLGSLAVRLMGALAIPIVAMSAASWAHTHNIGIFYSLDWPFWLICLLSLVILDLAIYLQHVASHHIPVLWRLHRVHHSDRDFDVTTAIRFHPIEICLSMLYKVAIILFLGIPLLAVFLFEVLLNACAMFNHANIKLPIWLDAILRRIIVTPDMHRVHHSVKECETNSNYGFNLSIWDYVFKTYKKQPEEGHSKMIIGLPAYQNDNPTKASWSLLLPFVSTRQTKNAKENISE